MQNGQYASQCIKVAIGIENSDNSVAILQCNIELYSVTAIYSTLQSAVWMIECIITILVI